VTEFDIIFSGYQPCQVSILNQQNADSVRTPDAAESNVAFVISLCSHMSVF